ncbi:EthD family reductase [Lihuaxuella thermophila]|uniref:EthD domain-containing protein n=1 Tax=Lihuaxuella thermophila TaxID=1173111 RepID=A0A1H8BKH5_9BACL|nr:EthD family reductase [Lihuaxuella thermophila]SEM82644.1 conserved hypothetical protein [Lihuaxuella thermophila]
MFKMIALYKEMDDPSFEDFYRNEFLPKLLRVPGVVKVRVNRLVSTGISSEKYALLAETYYESAEAMEAAMKRPEAAEITKMILEKAAGSISIYFAPDEEVYTK